MIDAMDVLEEESNVPIHVPEGGLDRVELTGLRERESEKVLESGMLGEHQNVSQSLKKEETCIGKLFCKTVEETGVSPSKPKTKRCHPETHDPGSPQHLNIVESPTSKRKREEDEYDQDASTQDLYGYDDSYQCSVGLTSSINGMSLSKRHRPSRRNSFLIPRGIGGTALFPGISAAIGVVLKEEEKQHSNAKRCFDNTTPHEPKSINAYAPSVDSTKTAAVDTGYTEQKATGKSQEKEPS